MIRTMPNLSIRKSAYTCNKIHVPLDAVNNIGKEDFAKIQLPSTPIIPINPISRFESIPSLRRTRLQTSNGMFDPNNSSPANEFMQTLKLRMDVYYC